MSKIALTGNASGTGVFTIASPNSNTDRTLTLPDETGTVLTSGTTTVLPKGVPAFSYENTTAQSISSTTWTKVTVNSQIFDTTTSDFSSSRFTASVAGYYQFNGCIRCNGSSITGIVVALYKNGSIVGYGNALQSSVPADNSINVSEIIYLNGSTDYVELYGFIIGTSPNFAYAAAGANARFSGALMGAA